MHFAAAATMMFRMFGVPARYVVGYVAPQELFSENADQTYTAVLEDDNAHTWVEIYQPFLGWTPVEVTPGMETEFVDQTEEKEQSDACSGGSEDGDGRGRNQCIRFCSSYCWVVHRTPCRYSEVMRCTVLADACSWKRNKDPCRT